VAATPSSARLSRTELLARGGKGVALLLAGSTLGELVSQAQVPATAADIDFSYPSGSFASRGSIAKLGVQLESTALGAYLGAVEGFQTDALKQRAARAAASESQHLSVFAAELGGRRIGAAFPRPLTIDRVSGVLDKFTS